MDCRQEDVCAFVVAGCDASEVFEAAEHALNDVAAFVSILVVTMRMFACRIGRDHRFDTPPGEFIAQAVGVIGSVGQQASRMAHHADQAACTDQIVRVARCDEEGDRTADLVGQRMDFGCLAAARPADGVVERPPFAPAAERWALM